MMMTVVVVVVISVPLGGGVHRLCSRYTQTLPQ